MLKGEDLNQAYCESLDAEDPLAHWYEAFNLPDGITYCDGMSLGVLPVATVSRLKKVVEHEWGEGLIRSWNAAGWIDAPKRVGGKLAPLLGVDPHEVVVGDSTSVNLFKLLTAALRLRPDRNIVLMEKTNFPTDIYIARGVQQLHPHIEIKLVDDFEKVTSLSDDVAVVFLTHVNYKTAQMHDIGGVTKRVHAAGAIALWDLSHSTGAVPLNLNRAEVDMAVGCGYKYLNGGPGAPAFMFVATRHLERTEQPITAWIGHDKPFDFSLDYVPAEEVTRLLSGTPPIISLAALESGVDIWSDVDITSVRKKSIALMDLFLTHVESCLGADALPLLSPRDPEQRGSHLAFQHANGYEIVQALIARGVVGDFREPDVMRFGFTPLYMRFVDAWHAADQLVDVIQSHAWDQPQYRERATVT